MARNDGIDRTTVRNVSLTEGDIGKTQQHNEREKDSYSNQDIVPERSELNVHYKVPDAGYAETFQQMEKDGTLSTRGLKTDAAHYGELVFDVNSAYFFNHGGYEYAKQFYAEAYRSAVKIVGGEQYSLSAVMHADERNAAMSDKLGFDVYHYHMHVVYIPVVEKEIRWSKRCKDEKLRGTVRETIAQVSHSKKWQSKPALDETGKPLLTKKGKVVLHQSYSVLQDDYFNHMREAGYTDVQRGERGSTEEHLTVVEFKVEQEKKRLAELQAQKESMAAEIIQLGSAKEQAQEKTEAAQEKLKQIAPRVAKVDAFVEKFGFDPNDLPEAGLLESARSYRENKVLPLFRKMAKAMADLYNRDLNAESKRERIEDDHRREVSALQWKLEQSEGREKLLREKASRHDKIVKVLGKEQVDQILAAQKEMTRKKEQERAV